MPLRLAIMLAFAVALAVQSAPTAAETKRSISNTAVLDELAAVRPDPKWNAEQKRQTREISSAAERLSAAIKDFEKCQQKTVKNLDREISRLEAEQEKARNERQRATTSFQNADQKANQLHDLLSTVIKAMNQMKMGITHNML